MHLLPLGGSRVLFSFGGATAILAEEVKRGKEEGIE
jgi:hypothetical protein